MDQVDPHRQWADIAHRGGHDCGCGDAFGRDVGASAERNVPHVFDDDAVTAAGNQCLGIGLCMADDVAHPIALVARRAGHRPAVDHTDDGFGGAKNVGQRRDLQAIEV